MCIRDSNKYKMTLPLSDSYETLGGLIFNETEYIPKEEEIIIINGYKIIIKEATSSKIEKILITKNIQEE